MKNRQLHRPFELLVSDLDTWNERPLVYHFFEIVLILKGTGTRIINYNNLAYDKGSIFLFTPLDCRGFHAVTPTRFCSIRFSEVFLGYGKNTSDQQRIVGWLKRLEHIFYHHNRFARIFL